LKKRNCSPKTSGRKKTKRENIFWKKIFIKLLHKHKEIFTFAKKLYFVREQKRIKTLKTKIFPE
jgi:hypothetical protein